MSKKARVTSDALTVPLDSFVPRLTRHNRGRGLDLPCEVHTGTYSRNWDTEWKVRNLHGMKRQGICTEWNSKELQNEISFC